ncbi:MAG TPA: c-type cytochrome [Acidimicrobiales bacterium]|nr:c-type cytochrome [Acidimicrobiales bacterium]
MRPARLHRVLVALPLVVTAAVTPILAGVGPGGPGGDSGDPGGADGDDQALIAEGRELYETGCSSCHGANGRGVVEEDGGVRGPSLENSGEAAAYYYLSTGRMPLANSEEQPKRKEPAYGPEEIEALVAYVGTLGNGPPVPDVDPEAGDLALGGEVFRANCQACHGAAGTGGALSYGRAAPRLTSATPKQIASAVRVGPGEMPVFGPDVIDDEELNGLVRYVRYLADPEDPGGLPIGRTGPIPEGFVAWLIGMVALLGLVVWIGTRSPIRPARGSER